MLRINLILAMIKLIIGDSHNDRYLAVIQLLASALLFKADLVKAGGLSLSPSHAFRFPPVGILCTDGKMRF